MATPKKSGKKGGKSASGGGVQRKSGLNFPTGRINTMIKKGRYARRVSRGAGVYMAGLLEYMTSELLELASKAAKGRRITPRAICLAIRYDQDLGNLFESVTISRGGVPESTRFAKKAAKKAGGSKKKGAAAGGAKKKDGGAALRAAVASGKHMSGPKLSREESAAAAKLVSTTHKWQYLDNGKVWSDYDAAASKIVEQAFAEWKTRPQTDVRSVASGSWKYMVDFNNMLQQNTQHASHTQRAIRRVLA